MGLNNVDDKELEKIVDAIVKKITSLGISAFATKAVNQLLSAAGIVKGSEDWKRLFDAIKAKTKAIANLPLLPMPPVIPVTPSDKDNNMPPLLPPQPPPRLPLLPPSFFLSRTKTVVDLPLLLVPFAALPVALSEEAEDASPESSPSSFSSKAVVYWPSPVGLQNTSQDQETPIPHNRQRKRLKPKTQTRIPEPRQIQSDDTQADKGKVILRISQTKTKGSFLFLNLLRKIFRPKSGDSGKKILTFPHSSKQKKYYVKINLMVKINSI